MICLWHELTQSVIVVENFRTHSFVAFSYKHSLVQGRNASRSGGEKASAKHQMKVRQSLHSKFTKRQVA
jgi:hypothetical protein